MRAPVPRATVAPSLVLALCLVLGGLQVAVGCSSPKAEPPVPIDPAVAAARRDFEQGDPHLVTVGEPPCVADPEFGVPVRSLGYASPERLCFASLYNREMSRLLRASRRGE